MENEFTPITTQEEFNSAIKSRIQREQAKYSDYDELKTKIADYEKQIGDLNSSLTSLNEKITNHDAEIAERDSRIKAYEQASVKTKVAQEMGLSFDAINFLQGDDEESIRNSAESLKSLIGTKTVPLANTEGTNLTSEQAALKGMLNNLFN